MFGEENELYRGNQPARRPVLLALDISIKKGVLIPAGQQI